MHTEQSTIQLNTGIEREERSKICNGLSKVLADSYYLMLKTHNYHWNVKGLNFRQIHLLTEELYTELFEAIDEIAERIRSLGFNAPGSIKEFDELTSITQGDGTFNDKEMLSDLLSSHESLIRTAREALPAAADASDEASVDLLTHRLDVHEKTAWMLRSMLDH
jgi:starvation-inducible DNA-binding protein